jgi:hypothetical protein
MTTDAGSLEELARKVRIALETADLASYRDLLDPDVHWGPPGDTSPPCQNRDQVIAWYERGRQKGTRATVSELEVLGDQILLGLVVTGNEEAPARSGRAARWQVLSVRGGRIVDIVGFEQKIEAVAWARRAAS